MLKKELLQKIYVLLFTRLSFILITCMSTNHVKALVKSFKKDADGVTCILDKGVMKVKICKDDIAEVRYTFMNSFPAKTSIVINNTWHDKPTFSVSEKE